MKTFVYEKKKGSKVVAIFNNVIQVCCNPESNNICIMTNDNRTYLYSKKTYKTTTYQN